MIEQEVAIEEGEEDEKDVAYDITSHVEGTRRLKQNMTSVLFAKQQSRQSARWAAVRVICRNLTSLY